MAGRLKTEPRRYRLTGRRVRVVVVWGEVYALSFSRTVS